MERPNIILIFCDDLGYGDLGCYGSTLNHTPRLDLMAGEGLRFTDFYASASVCSPSRASLLTGCYAQRVGLGTGEAHGVLFPADSIGLSPDERTLSRVLKDAGYATACVGKWHLGDQREFLPDRHGFDSYLGMPYSNDMHRSHPMNHEHRFPDLPLLRIDRRPGVSGLSAVDRPADDRQTVAVEEIEPDQTRLELRYTDVACKFIREHAAEPFFLYFPHMYVHRPLFAPDEFLPSPRPDGFNGYTDTSAEDYSAEVGCLDWSTGRILDTLDDLGISDETLVIFTSDNGSNLLNGGSNAPLRGRKGQFYEGGFRMPCIVRWPAVIPTGTVCSALATTMDILPTIDEILDAAETERSEGASAPAGAGATARRTDGASLLPILKQPGGGAEVRDEFAFYSGTKLSAVRQGRFKLHCESGELFDLTSDIGETVDVSAEHPETVDQLKHLAERYRGDLGDGERNGRGVRPPGRVENPRPVVEWAGG